MKGKRKDKNTDDGVQTRDHRKESKKRIVDSQSCQKELSSSPTLERILRRNLKKLSYYSFVIPS